MARYLFVKGGTVRNVVEYPAPPTILVGDDGEDIVLDPTGSTGVGAAYDITPDLVERRYNSMDTALIKELFRLTNEVRTLRSLSVITAAQYKNQFKSQG